MNTKTSYPQIKNPEAVVSIESTTDSMLQELSEQLPKEVTEDLLTAWSKVSTYINNHPQTKNQIYGN